MNTVYRIHSLSDKKTVAETTSSPGEAEEYSRAGFRVTAEMGRSL